MLSLFSNCLILNIMKHNIFFFSVFLSLLFLFSSCEKKNLNSITTIKYGTSFGMCVGYCINDLTITGNEATFTKRKNGDEKASITCKSNLSIETLNAIEDHINLNQFNSLPAVIGCPDCADGGAEYVEINNDGKVKRVTFEYGNPPKQLVDLVAILRMKVKSFENCK